MRAYRDILSARGFLVGILMGISIQSIPAAESGAKPAPAEKGEADRQATSGVLRGVTTAPGGFSLAAVNVVIQSVSGSLQRRLVSDSDGIFLIDDLQPGEYKINASKDGFACSSAVTVQIAQSKTTNASIQLTQGAFGSLRGVTAAPGGFSLAAVNVVVRSVSGSIERTSAKAR